MQQTHQTVDIAGSPWRFAKLIALGSGMLAVCLLLILCAPAEGQVIGWIGFIFFGAAMLVIVKRAFSRGPVITLAPQGFLDRRVSAEFVPWHEIERISTSEYSGQKVMAVQVSDATWDAIRITRVARMSRSANRALGLDGLAISDQGLTMTYDDLLAPPPPAGKPPAAPSVHADDVGQQQTAVRSSTAQQQRAGGRPHEALAHQSVSRTASPTKRSTKAVSLRITRCFLSP